MRSLRATITDPIVLRRLVRDYAYCAVINLLCAVLTTYVIFVSPSFFENLVFSMSIGFTSITLIESARILLWRDAPVPRFGLIIIILLAAPIAYVMGNLIASRLLHISTMTLVSAAPENSIRILLFIVIVSMLVTWFFWSREQLASLRIAAETEKARAAANERQALQAQLQMLQAQIEPHMLFNTLANLQGLIAIDSARAQVMLEQLITYLRATLSASRVEQTTLEHEFELMGSYLALMAIRMGKRLRYQLDLPEDLRTQRLPPMLLQPLVENAIKHGLEPKMDGGEVLVSAQISNNTLLLQVRDNGLGLEPSPNASMAKQSSNAHEGSHIGLANIHDRLLALYGENAHLTLSDNTPSGVVATLSLPI